MRRRLFGRSQDSSGSMGNYSPKHLSPLPSPTVNEAPQDKGKEKEGSMKERDGARDSSSIGSHRQARPKKSGDGTRQGDRLSIFGTTFGGNLGKGRKPPPRYVCVSSPSLSSSSRRKDCF
jgi:hypothetical protein